MSSNAHVKANGKSETVLNLIIGSRSNRSGGGYSAQVKNSVLVQASELGYDHLYCGELYNYFDVYTSNGQYKWGVLVDRHISFTTHHCRLTKPPLMLLLVACAVSIN